VGKCDEIQNNNIDDDMNGYVDDYYGWDWVNNDNDPMDDHGMALIQLAQSLQ